MGQGASYGLQVAERLHQRDEPRKRRQQERVRDIKQMKGAGADETEG